MKYHIKFNNGNDEMLVINDDAFYGFIRIAVQHNHDIMDFHVRCYPDNTMIYRCDFGGKRHYYTYEDFKKFFNHEGGQHRDLRITIV